MQNLLSTEVLGNSSKTKSYPQDTMYNYDFKSDERHVNSSPRQESGRREDSSEVVVDFEGPVVSSSRGTKLYSLITKRNWPAAVKRCKGEGAKEAMTWIVEKNIDGSICWKLLPIHQVSV